MLKVKADGAEHAVSGHAYYDTAMVKVLSTTLTGKFTNHLGAKTVTGEVVEKRVAPGPPGSHAVSGSWLQQHAAGNEAMRSCARSPASATQCDFLCSGNSRQ